MKRKINELKISLVIFITLFILTLVIFFSGFAYEKKMIKEICDWELQDAVFRSIAAAVNNIPGYKTTKSREEMYKERIAVFELNDIEYDHYEDSILYFSENDKWEYRTILKDHKLVGRKVPKKDILIDKLNFETHKFMFGKMDLESIIAKYKEALYEKRVFIYNPVYITVDSEIFTELHYDNFADSIRAQFNYITKIFRTGFLDEVLYQAYLNITFSIVYMRMDKVWLYSMVGCLGVSLSVLLFLYVDFRVEERKHEIVHLKGNNYRFGNMIFMYEKQKIINGKVHYSIPPTLADILLLLLENDAQGLNKDILLYKLTNSNNVYSNISRLRKFLKEINSPFKLSLSKENSTYRLLPKDKFMSPQDETETDELIC